MSWQSGLAAGAPNVISGCTNKHESFRESHQDASLWGTRWETHKYTDPLAPAEGAPRKAVSWHHEVAGTWDTTGRTTRERRRPRGREYSFLQTPEGPTEGRSGPFPSETKTKTQHGQVKGIERTFLHPKMSILVFWKLVCWQSS